VSESPQILIVDDAPVNVALVEGILAGEGFRTVTADCGPQAIEICRTGRPDLVLMDVVMPGESGFDTCIRLKSEPATADIPIVFLSALDDANDRVTGLKIGAVDFISKPVHAEEVLARVRIHLRIQETNRRLIRESSAHMEELRYAQQSILIRPETLPAANFSVCYRPLEGVGGDFYDVVEIAPDVYAYFVADISGHGPSSSFLTSALKALLRQYAKPVYSPEDAMQGVGSVLRQLLTDEQFVTACYACLYRQTGRLTVVSAGHPPMLIVSPRGQLQAIAMDSEPLGVFNSTLLQRKDVTVGQGDRLFLYTDGLIEHMPCGNRTAGLEALQGACVWNRGVRLAEAPHRIVGELWPPGTSVQDDLLLLVVEVM
jgi:phosphoserine phosphatase RsbU/P